MRDLGSQSEIEFRKGDGTYIEIWNLVFMQYNRDLSGKLNPLPKPSVDTGMGLERIAAVKQGVKANYDTDLLRDIIRVTEKMSGESYYGRDYTERDLKQDKQYAVDVAFRVIADHGRAAAFLIADGVLPGGDGRGYVLRRLIRRASRHGRELGFTKPFLYQVAGAVVDMMGEVYPELLENRERSCNLIKSEEEKFLRTLDSGLEILSKNVERVKTTGGKMISGEIVFMLHDSYGFPLDLTQDIARVSGLNVDVLGFSERMTEQRERARLARASSAEQTLIRTVRPQFTKFVGYEFLEFESSVLGIFSSNGETKTAKEEQEIALVTRESPFYAESGGQLGDTGTITSNTATLEVIDTQKVGGDCFVHICKVTEGDLSAGDRVRLKVDEWRRRRLEINHSVTHLLQMALREVLGNHVQQAGSRVAPDFLRFDFSHFEGLHPDKLDEIERIVNSELRANYSITTEIMSLEEAKRAGATALFGEKYAGVVRVVTIGPRSKELCGGTHVRSSGEIGQFTVLSESANAAGIRRIEAAAGEGALFINQSRRKMVLQIAQLLSSGTHDLVERVERILQRSKELERNLVRASQVDKGNLGVELVSKARENSKGYKVVAEIVEGSDPKGLRELADDLRRRLGWACIALGSVVEGKAILLTAVTENLAADYHAGEILKEIASMIGSKGGGRADLAQAGGGEPSKLREALNRFVELVQ